MSGTSIPCPVARHAQEQPDAVALVTPEGAVNYAEMAQRVAAVSEGLRARGWERSARVALHLPSGEAYLVVLWALWRLGAVACPLSTREPWPRLAERMQAIGCTRLIAAQPDAIEEVDVLAAGALRTASLIQSDARPVLDLEQPATILFTSGSTGQPKAALHTFGNHYYSALGSAANIPLGVGDRWLLNLTLYHVSGLAIVVRCMLAGATVVVAARGMSTTEAIRTYGITHASLVSTQLGRLLRENDGAALARAKAVLLGGSAMPPALLAEAHARGWPLHTSYGLTEMSSQVTTTPSGASRDELGTSGRLLPHRELKLASDGEILVRGATLFAGYVDENTLDPARDADGWFHTHDLGRIDERGFLHVLGRKDNLFISGGENIQPEEIEAALAAMDGIAQAVVVPVPDATFGERPVAFVRAIGTAPGEAAMRVHLEGRIARFKIPDAFYPWPADAPTGLKPDRTFFRALARARRSSS